MAKLKLYKEELPSLSTEQMVVVDELMMHRYNISLLQMMENAGQALARLAVQRFLQDQAAKESKVVVLIGKGGNGGGALVAARRLHSWGYPVEIYLSGAADDLSEVTSRQLATLSKMQLKVSENQALQQTTATLVIDGIIGYSLHGSPRGKARQLINWVNEQSAPVLSLDTPSGLDLTTGTAYDATVKAAATMTLALPKTGLLLEENAPYVGELYLADIGVPTMLYREKALKIKVKSKLFRKRNIWRIR